MSEAKVEIFKTTVSLTQTLKLHGERSSCTPGEKIRIVPLSSYWSAKKNFRFRFLVDAASVCVQICTAEQAMNWPKESESQSVPEEVPDFGAKVPTDASPELLVVKCARCHKVHHSILLAPWRLELPSSISTDVDLATILSSGCCDELQGRRVMTLIPRHCYKSVTLEVVLGACSGVPHPASSLRVLHKLHDERPHLGDLTLRVAGAELQAHRCVLAAYSPVLRGMLESPQPPSALDMKEVREEVMEAALRYMYGHGEEAVGRLDAQTRMALLVLAERYQMPGLKALCERALCMDTALDPLEVLALADVHNAQIVVEATIERILVHPDKNKILGESCSEDFIVAHPRVVKKLLSRCSSFSV